MYQIAGPPPQRLLTLRADGAQVLGSALRSLQVRQSFRAKIKCFMYVYISRPHLAMAQAAQRAAAASRALQQRCSRTLTRPVTVARRNEVVSNPSSDIQSI